jgi:hypothetical protein
VASEQGYAVFGQDFEAASHDLAEYLEVDAFFREAGYGERGQRGPAHRPHVVDRVERGDPSVIERVVDDGSEEVDGLNYRKVFAEAVYSRVVGRVVADDQVFIKGLSW